MLPIIQSLLYRPITNLSQPIIQGQEPIGPICPTLEAAGLLLPMEPQKQYYCLKCYRVCHRRLGSERSKDGTIRYFYRCPANKHSAEPRTFIDFLELRQWKVNFPALIEGISQSMSLSGNVYENLPGVSWKLGERNGREFFFIIGVTFQRTRDIIREFSTRPNAILFVRCDYMAEMLQSILDNTLLLTEQYVTITPEAKIVVDMEGIKRVIGEDELPLKPRYEFRQKEKTWTVRYEDEEQIFPDRLGFRYIAALLAKPNESIDAYELRRMVSGLDLPPLEHLSTNDHLTDADSLKKVRERYRELQTDLVQAADDPLVCDEIHQEMNGLSEYLKKHTGKPSRRKSNADELEKARWSVLRAYSTVLEILEKKMPKFFEHLKESIEIGKTCKYRPPDSISWVL